MKLARGSYTRSPWYFLTAYTVRSEWVRWAIERGGLVDLKSRPVTLGCFGDADDLALARKLNPRLHVEPEPPGSPLVGGGSARGPDRH